MLSGGKLIRCQNTLKWYTFNSYCSRIINTTSIDFIVKKVKPFHDKCTQFDIKDLENTAYIEEEFSYIEDDTKEFSKLEIKQQEKGCVQVKNKREDWAEILVEELNSGLNLAEPIVSKLKKRDVNFLKSLVGSSSLMEYSKEKELIHWIYFGNRTLLDYTKFKGIAYRTAVDRKKKVLIKLRKILEGMEY